MEGTENQGFLVETFRGALVMKTSHATQQAWEEYQRNFSRLTNLRWSTMKLGLYRDTFTAAFVSLTALAILWLGSYRVIGGSMSIGQLLAFYGILRLGQLPIRGDHPSAGIEPGIPGSEVPSRQEWRAWHRSSRERRPSSALY